jgi:hypothetical protein
MKKKRTRGVFNEISERNLGSDFLDSFIDFLPHIFGHTDSIKEEPGISKEIQQLHTEYFTILNNKEFRATINKLADIEYRILQFHCYTDVELTYGLFTQERSGESAEYIIARAPFPMRKQARQELRVYIGKLSDYKGKTLEQLQKDKKFILSSKEKMKQSMREQMGIL